MVSPMRRPSQVRQMVLAIAGAVVVAGGLTFGWPSASVAAVGCGPNTAAGDPSQTADARVVLQGKQFVPASVHLADPGMTVCWEHLDGDVPHTITLDASPAGPGFESNAACQSNGSGGAADPQNCFQQGDQSFKIIFTTTGTYNYHCRIHSGMTGTVVVGDGKPPTVKVTTTVPKTTTTKASTATTVGTLTSTSTTEATAESTTSSSTTSSTIGFSTATTAPGTALGNPSSKDDNKPSGVLEAIGVLLLAAVVAALIPAWRRLT